MEKKKYTYNIQVLKERYMLSLDAGRTMKELLRQQFNMDGPLCPFYTKQLT